jgi:hypothetical protein
LINADSALEKTEKIASKSAQWILRTVVLLTILGGLFNLNANSGTKEYRAAASKQSQHACSTV